MYFIRIKAKLPPRIAQPRERTCTRFFTITRSHRAPRRGSKTTTFVYLSSVFVNTHRFVCFDSIGCRSNRLDARRTCPGVDPPDMRSKRNARTPRSYGQWPRVGVQDSGDRGSSLVPTAVLRRLYVAHTAHGGNRRSADRCRHTQHTMCRNEQWRARRPECPCLRLRTCQQPYDSSLSLPSLLQSRYRFFFFFPRHRPVVSCVLACSDRTGEPPRRRSRPKKRAVIIFFNKIRDIAV